MGNPFDFNPPLTEDGHKRALFWAEYFQDKSIDAVYCTKMLRTRQTIAPFLEHSGLACHFYDLHQLYSEEFLENTQGRKILIVGHQTTIPEGLNKLLKTNEFRKIPVDVYGKLFTVSFPKNKAASVQITEPQL